MLILSDNRLRKGESVLCAVLPPRIYESLKTLCCLANADRPLQSHEIATEAKLPPAQTAKILQLMAWAGFVESRRGTKGGFWLVKPASRIRVTDVVAFFAHSTGDNQKNDRDPVLRALSRATARCQKEFRKVTVADIAKLAKAEEGRTGGRRKRIKGVGAGATG